MQRSTRPTSQGVSPRNNAAEHCVISPLSVRIPTAVQMTGIGRSKIYQLIKQGNIEVVKIGSATLIPVSSLQRLLEKDTR